MTKEENIAKLASLFSQVNTLVEAYNEAIQSANFSDAAKADTETVALINEYTSVARTIIFDECRAAPDPMMHAVRTLYYMTIAVKDQKEGDEKIPVRGIVSKGKAIDLMRLHTYCGGIGADKNWPYIAQKINYLLTARVVANINADDKNERKIKLSEVHDSYDMNDIAKDIDLGKDPASDKNMLATLQTIVTAMLGEGYAARKSDVGWLKEVYSKKGKTALSVCCANHRYLRNYLAEICNRIVTNGSYTAEYKTKKK